MSLRRTHPLLAALVLVPLLGWAKAPPPSADAAKQTSGTPAGETRISPSQGGWSFDLGRGHTGLSIGGSSRWNGLRFNWADHDVEFVRGVNVTLWHPEEGGNQDARYTGLSLGVVGPVGGTFRGVTVGFAPVAAHELTGINLGILGMVSNGEVNGLNLAGLGAVAQGHLAGLSAAGLGLVANGAVVGIGFGGLALVANDGIHGLGLGGLAVIADGPVEGALVGGLAAVGNGDLKGIAAGGLAAVTGRQRGLSAAGLAVVGKGLTGAAVSGLAVVESGPVQGITGAGLVTVTDGRLVGLTAAGLAVVVSEQVSGAALAVGHVRTPKVRGVAAAGWVRVERVDGLTLGLFNQVRGVQRGLAIGLVNSAKVLQGVQIGLVNHAGNNPPALRWTPLLNAHFG